VSIISGGTFHALVFRGTEDLQDWLRNFEMLVVPWKGPGKVHAGFLRALHEIWGELHPVLATIAGPVFYTGHSLGGAIAMLAAAHIEEARRPLAVYTFGCPRCGNETFAKEHPLRDRVYRFENNRDAVPLMPPFCENTGELHYITSDHRLVVNPTGTDRVLDRFKDDDTHTVPRDFPLESLTDHAPVNYVAWMQRFATGG
jgi:predicted lipase